MCVCVYVCVYILCKGNGANVCVYIYIYIHAYTYEETNMTTHRKTAAYPNRVSGVLSLDDSAALIVSFYVKPFLPQQTFVRFTNGGKSAVFRAKSVPKVEGKLMCIIDMGDAGERDFGFLGGTYVVDVLVGDASMHEPITWEVSLERCMLLCGFGVYVNACFMM